MDLPYVVAPIVGYLSAGILKFIVNSLNYKELAFDRIGLGGMPSTHNTITSATFFTVCFVDGVDSPVASVALAISLVVAIDSMDLRQKIAGHALIIKHEFKDKNVQAAGMKTQLGHRPIEVLAAWVLGLCCGFVVSIF